MFPFHLFVRIPPHDTEGGASSGSFFGVHHFLKQQSLTFPSNFVPYHKLEECRDGSMDLTLVVDSLREEANPMMSQGAASLDPALNDRLLSGRFRKAYGLALAAALVLALAAPSPCWAQTLSLGNAGDFGLFGAYNANTGGSATLIGGPASVYGSVGLDAGSSFSGTTSITGSVYINNDPSPSVGPASYSGSGTPGGGIVTGGATNTFLSQGSQAAIQAATTAESWTNSSSANQLTVSNNSVYLSSAHSGQNVVTVNYATNTNTSLLTLSNVTLNIYGSANEQVVFNFTGSHTVTWTNVTVALYGISAGNVFFNFIGGNVGIVGGAINGNILDVVNGTSMSLDNGVVVNGSVVSDGFVDMGNAVITTPEMPTVLTAGLATLLVAVPAGFSRLRRRRGTASTLPNP
jgi:hypothetical protein